MSQRLPWRLAGLSAALALTACASTSATGVTGASEATYVASVEVVARDPGAPAGFAAILHDAVMKEASFYGDAGRPISLRIELDKVHFKNPLKAMIVGDDNQARGDVAVLDPTTGQQSGKFVVQVDAERSGAAGGSIAMGVLGALDPTGIVDIGSAAGSAASADINRSGAARGLIANFAAETLRQTFGDAKARAVKLEKQRQTHGRPKAEDPAGK